MITEQELDERISWMIDEDYPAIAERFENESIVEKVRNAILALEIETLKKAVEMGENVSGLHSVQGSRPGT